MTKDLKSLFITFPQRSSPDNFPPYGAMTVINALQDAGYNNTYFYNLDVLRTSRKEAVDYIVNFCPDVFCISSPVSTGYENAKFFSIEIKKLLPNVTVILGGNLAASAENLLKKTGVDFCVLGEGERVCCQLFDKLVEDRPLKEFVDIIGIAFLEGSKIVNTGYAGVLPKEEIYNVDWDILDSLSIKHYFPVIGDLDPESITFKYFFPDRPGNSDSISIEKDRLSKTIGVIPCSKGCIARCSFCHRFNKGMRFVPPEIIIVRLKELIERFNVGAIVFSDECFGSNLRWLRKFCELIKPLNLLWRVGGMRVNMVSLEIIEMMKDAGCRTIIYGMETGSEGILKVMEKRVTSKDNYEAMRYTVEAGLYTIPQLVIGMPGETPETIRETADFIAYAQKLNRSKNPRHISINFAQALPGTPLYEYGRITGRIGTTVDAEEKYLLEISDRNAADATTTLNFTDYPRLILFSWKYLIVSIANYEYAKKFGINHYYKIIHQDGNRLGFWTMIKNKQFDSLLYSYPVTAYRLRRFMWVISLVYISKRNGLIFGGGLLKEFISFMISRLWRQKHPFEYKSLRKIIMQNTAGNIYSGTSEVVSLRKGR
ncbi:MAG: radical SAM protein [Candidatus Scalindua sp.]|jgi:anaerobic magnesium-protoporphyrin IX monomethyl ester cyclase|nr:radical SAM protein [Candidatus Scalindua sp.]MBT6226426.1 radical SAM protein [Candidatus Scalindua sp.]